MGQIVRYRRRRPWEKAGRPSGIEPPSWQARGKRPQRRRRLDSVRVALLAVIVGAVGGLGIQAVYDPGLADKLKSTSLYAAVASIGKPFGLCHAGYQANCVIDGDTIDYQGQRVRMVDYDAPEIGEPKCPHEKALGHQATRRLLEILNSGPVAVTPHGDRDIDQYGRKLRLVTVNGLSVGNYLMGEGLAVPWAGRRHHWCG